MINVGILHSLTGLMAISESLLVDAALMAIAEINQSGGVLGQAIAPSIEDGASNEKTFAQKARKLIQQDQVATLFGCWTSACRKAVIPVLEDLDVLLWYPLQYEGLEESKHIFYTGSCPNQQVKPALEWLVKQHGKRFYLVGSDYVFPRTVHKIIDAQLKGLGGNVLEEAYVPLGGKDFTHILDRILQLQPDVIFNTLNGDSNVAFYQQYYQSGIQPAQMPIMAVSVAEPELQRIAAEAAGTYASWSYFQSLDLPKNQQFVQNFQARYGSDRVTSDPIEAAYTQVYLWKQAVEAARSLEINAVRNSAIGQTFEAPSGLVRIDENQHLWKGCYLGKAQPNGQFEIVYGSDQSIQPMPWLGIKELTDPVMQNLLMNLLAEVPQAVQHISQLEQKSQELETTLIQLQDETTARQQTQTELQAMFTAMNDYVVVHNGQGQYLKILSAQASVLYKPEIDRLGKTLYDVLPKDQADNHLHHIQQVLQTQQAVNVEYQLPIQGEIRWYSAYVAPLTETTVIWAARNISDLKRVEADLRQSENKKRALLEIIPDLMLQMNREGIYLDFIPPTNFNVVGEELIGKSEYEVMPLKHAQKRMHYVERALQTGELQLFESTLEVDGTLQYEESRIIPFEENEVLIIVRDVSDRKRSELALAQAHAEIVTLNQQLKSENLRMGAELAVTRQLQEMVLPREAELKAILPLDIAGFMQSAEEVGGDYYDVVQHNGKVRIGIGDVTGHGLESGVLMLMTQTAVRTLIANGEEDPIKLLNTINSTLYDNTHRMKSQKNMTLSLLQYEMGVLNLTGQHEDVIILRTDGEIECIDTFELGFPLGLEKDISAFVAQTNIQLNLGDVAVLYTDGITEAMNLKKEQYGLERFHRALQMNRDRSATEIQQRVIFDVMEFIGDQRVFDDITLLVLKRR
ncbi:urea ABC transporter substrate-binding protein [Leptolyngbya sp. Cla-17]|uniref:urea ABC transporter substrate-binding protein n=1 Tax=Leptolyngbya sp. Cla-17 TaxID=2803751 RepID=UPI00247AD214|nr:urea ABC transporter substrate-binding protein [Leptolyngbya sp. Cla-17]